jgi:hypothetical protein
MNAKQMVADGMQACLPPGCPLPFNAIISARFLAKRIALATVELFDGLPGTIEVSERGLWCLQWKELAGGAINWNGRNWERVNKFSIPKQLELAFEEATA